MFDRFVMVDWSGGNARGPTPKPDAIWIGDGETAPLYCPDRNVAEDRIVAIIDDALRHEIRLCIGFDFAFGYPVGFAKHLTRRNDPFAVWDWFNDRVEDTPNANNRVDIAASINATLPGIGPFWGNGMKRDVPSLPRRGNDRTFRWTPERRDVERRAKGSFECWQLFGAGSVGSQIIMGLPVLARLRKQFGPYIAVWPFETHEAPITFVEIWPSLIKSAVSHAMQKEDIKDAVQVSLLAGAFRNLGSDGMARMMAKPRTHEGWILGVGHEAALNHAAISVDPVWRSQ